MTCRTARIIRPVREEQRTQWNCKWWDDETNSWVVETHVADNPADVADVLWDNRPDAFDEIVTIWKEKQ